MLHVILGADYALAKRELDRLLATLDASGMSTDRMDGASHSADALLAAVTAAPFFGTRRVVVLSGLLTQRMRKEGRAVRASDGGAVQRLTSSVPETTVLILFEPEIGELSAQIKKQLPREVSISVNDAPRGQALMDLTIQIASEQGSALDRSIARIVLDRLFPGYWPQAPQNRAFDKPPSIQQLHSELAKLCVAAVPGQITAELVDDLVPQRSEERIFPLLDAVVSGGQRAALQETDNALRSGEDASRMLNQIYQQIELAVGVTAADRPQDALQASRALGGASPYRINKLTQAARRSSISSPRQLRFALENDRKLKTGRIRAPDEALVDLVIRATQKNENR